MKKELICICCPMGCRMTVIMDENKEDIRVSGNTCKRGEIYAKKEVTDPKRMLTSSIRVKDGKLAMVSVKTKEDIPKDKIFDCMKEIRRVKVFAPVERGQVLIEDCAGTGVSVIATKTVERREKRNEGICT